MLELPEQPLLYTVAQATALLEQHFGRLPARHVWRAIRDGRVTAKRPEGTRQFLLPREQVAVLANGLRERRAVLLPRFLTVKVLARLLGKSEKAVLHLVNAGKIPALRHPRGWFMLPIEPVNRFYDLTIPDALVETADPGPHDEVLPWDEVLERYGEPDHTADFEEVDVEVGLDGDTDGDTDASN